MRDNSNISLSNGFSAFETDFYTLPGGIIKEPGRKRIPGSRGSPKRGYKPMGITTPYINGQEIAVDPAAMTPVVNPANGKPFSRVFMARPEHMTRAIDAAYAVKDLWGNTLPSERELILFRAADVLESMRDEVVDLLIEEGG